MGGEDAIGPAIGGVLGGIIFLMLVYAVVVAQRNRDRARRMFGSPAEASSNVADTRAHNPLGGVTPT